MDIFTKIGLFICTLAASIVAAVRLSEGQLSLLEGCAVIMMFCCFSIVQTLHSLSELIRGRIFEQQHSERRGYQD